MHLYLSIGLTYNEQQISGRYTRFMRDEVLAQWRLDQQTTDVVPAREESTNNVHLEDSGQAEREPASSDLTEALHVYVHVSGGRVYGRPRWRNQMLIRSLPLALRAIRYGDAYLINAHPPLDEAPVYVHFQSHLEKYNRVEFWGQLKEYEVPLPKASKYRR